MKEILEMIKRLGSGNEETAMCNNHLTEHSSIVGVASLDGFVVKQDFYKGHQYEETVFMNTNDGFKKIEMIMNHETNKLERIETQLAEEEILKEVKDLLKLCIEIDNQNRNYVKYQAFRDKVKGYTDKEWLGEDLMDAFLQDCWENTESEEDLDWADLEIIEWRAMGVRYAREKKGVRFIDYIETNSDYNN